MDRALAADTARREAIGAFEAKRAEQKQLGKLIPQAQGDEKAALLAQTKTLAAEVKEAEAAQVAAEQEWREALMSIPNLAADEAPAGGEDDFVVIETIGTPPEFDFEPRDHVELGRMLGAIDIERGAKVSGSRFYFLTGVGAQLEFALINMAMDQARNAGFTQIIAPTLVKPRAMEGTGFLGQAADDVYRIEGEDLYLVGTSEVPMAAYHSDEILDGVHVPLRYAAFSPCFRKEAGSHGKDTKGIFRVHWFDKVEMFVYTTLEDSFAEHLRLLGWEKEFLDKLELVYRVIDVAAGDLGTSAQRKFDCEAWIRIAGPVPRAHVDLQLHRLPDPPAGHPRPGRRRHRRADRDPQRDALLDRRARSSPSSRPISRPTARCGCRRPCSPTSVASTCSNRYPSRGALTPLGNGLSRRSLVHPAPRSLGHRRHPAEVGRGLRPELRGDPAARVRRRAPRLRRGCPHRAGQRALPARDDPDRGPARPAARRRRPALGGRLQRGGGLPLPAGRGGARGDLRRRARRRGGAAPTTRGPGWPSRSAAAATG